MYGEVKWFSQEKGYGYIIADKDGKEHYFNIRDVQGANLPRNGDIVSFESSQGKRGPKASSVTMFSKGRNSDDRVTCDYCGKKIVPRIITGPPTIRGARYTPVPIKSICPFCAGTYKEFNHWCFIATAVYGDYYSPEVIALRRFRDETLQPYAVGRIFVATYYRVSPPIAKYISRRPILAAAIRPLLDALAHRNS